MPRPHTVTFTMVAKDVDAIAASQTATAAGALTLSGALATAGGGTASLDVARHVAVYSTGDNSGVTFTASGTDRYGNVRTEAITGPTGASVAGTSTVNFKTVTGVSTSTGTTGPVTVGTASSADTPLYAWDWRKKEFSVTVQGEKVNGSYTYGIEHTLDNVQADGFTEDQAAVYADATMVSLTSSVMGSMESPVRASRAAITGFASGSLTVTFLQAG